MMNIPPARPEQNPSPRPRSDAFMEGFKKSHHAGTTHVSDNAGRMSQREYTDEQVFQTIRDGREYPSRKNPEIRIYALNSIDHANMRRLVVADPRTQTIITTLTRVPVPEPAPKRTQKPSNTKSKKKQQLAKKRARSAGNS